MSIITFKFRIKDATARRHLDRIARACNYVWNFCVATQREAERRRKGGFKARWPTAFDLSALTKGCASDLGLHSDTVNGICRQFVTSRDQNRRGPRFRVSAGAKRSLGWVPVIPRAIKVERDAVTYLKHRYRFWNSRDIEGDIKSGAFIQDARGRWYVTLACEVADNLPAGSGEVGVDLGLKTLAALSDGTKIEAPRFSRKHAHRLAVAQRARRKKRARAIHAKIANSRRHYLHEHSTRIAREHSLIAVGDASAAKLAKTRMAKSIFDAGWAPFRHMLRYKSARRQAVYVDVQEQYSSQTCSRCGSIPSSSPKGKGALGVRRWDCTDCGAAHDRDTNAAANILLRGRALPSSCGNSGSVGGNGAKPRCAFAG